VKQAAKDFRANVGQASSLPVRAASCRLNQGAKMRRQPADKISALHTTQAAK